MQWGKKCPSPFSTSQTSLQGLWVSERALKGGHRGSEAGCRQVEMEAAALWAEAVKASDVPSARTEENCLRSCYLWHPEPTAQTSMCFRYT
jgi:hypothetical protein